MEKYEAQQILKANGVHVDIDDNKTYVEIVEFLNLVPEISKIDPVPVPDTL